MDDAALDKLIADIQDFLRTSEVKKIAEPAPAEAPREGGAPNPRSVSRSIHRSARVARLLEACGYGWAAFVFVVVLYVLLTSPPRDMVAVAQFMMLCTFGLFTTLALISGSHRIRALLRIERNTREILRLRRRQNAILSRIADRR